MLTKKYTHTTELRDLGNGEFEVVDKIEWDSGNVNEIKRFKGIESEALKRFKELTDYWKKTFERMNKDKN